MPSRKRDRSKTPEVRWESLPDAPPVAPVSKVAKPDEREKKPAKESERAAEPALAVDGAAASVYAEAARSWERKAWRSLVVTLAALRGDPQTEGLLADKHPELRRIVDACGPSCKDSLPLSEAKVAAAKWFERCLRGSNNHGPSVRAGLCDQLRERLRDRAAALRGAGPLRLQAVLDSGVAEEEGPLVCSWLGAELEGSRYDGLWITRVGRGMYCLGDDQEGSGLPKVDSIGAAINRCVKVIVKASDSGLLIDGFFHEGERDPVPAGVPVGPFLSVYFEGLPLREAMAKWKSGRKDGEAAGLAALGKGLPPGWELRESRSKRGVYYYANPSKGLSQLERPTS